MKGRQDRKIQGNDKNDGGHGEGVKHPSWRVGEASGQLGTGSQHSQHFAEKIADIKTVFFIYGFLSANLTTNSA